MRTFGTQGIVRPDQHYVVARTEEVKNFINRIKEGRYIVLFRAAPNRKDDILSVGTR